MNDFERAANGLRALNKAMNGENFAEAVEKAGEVFVEEAKRRVVVRTGKLKADIRHEPYLRGFTYASEKVYVNSRYAHLIEYGHAAPRKPIVPDDAKALQIDLDSFAMRSRGGSASRRPFMRPAADASGHEMGRLIAIEVKRVIGKSRDIYGRNRNRTG